MELEIEQTYQPDLEKLANDISLLIGGSAILSNSHQTLGNHNQYTLSLFNNKHLLILFEQGEDIVGLTERAIRLYRQYEITK
jgi:hypothetical protein